MYKICFIKGKGKGSLLQALFGPDRGTRRGEWSAARPDRSLPPGKDTVPILQEAGWAPGPVWTGGKSPLHRHSIPDRPESMFYYILPTTNMFSISCAMIFITIIIRVALQEYQE